MNYASSLDILKRTMDHWTASVTAFLPNIITSICIFVISYFLSKWLRKVGANIFMRLFPNASSLLSLVEKVFTCFFWFAAIVLILNVMNLSTFITHVLAGAGIVGIIAGFAFQDIASNTFAGLLIRTQRPFEIGDWIEIQGYIGTVERLGLVGIGVQTYQGHMAYIPNQQIFSNPLLNYSTYGKVRIIVEVGVSYGDDLDHVEKMGLEAIRSLPMLLPDEKSDFFVTGIGASTYNCIFRYWVAYHTRTDFLRARSEGVRVIKKKFEEADICVAYNVMTLDFGVKGGVNLYDQPVPISIEQKEASLKENHPSSEGQVEMMTEEEENNNDSSLHSSSRAHVTITDYVPMVGEDVREEHKKEPRGNRWMS